jgi:hypothetical protein
MRHPLRPRVRDPKHGQIVQEQGCASIKDLRGNAVAAALTDRRSVRFQEYRGDGLFIRRPRGDLPRRNQIAGG